MRYKCETFLYLGLKAGFKHSVKSQSFMHAFLKIEYYLKNNMEYSTFKMNVKSSQVTFIYIALLTIQIVTKQLHNIKMGK